MPGIKKLSPVRKEDTGSPKIFSEEVWLIKSLEESLGGPQRKNREGVFYPSMLGSYCMRLLYLAYNGLLPEQVIDDNLQRIFDNGNFLEDRMATYFTKMDILLDREIVAKSDNPPISGRADFLLKHENYDTIGLELKSINDKGFEALKNRPKREHTVQLQIYLHILQLPYGVVLYENKNNQKLKAFGMLPDPDIWAQVLKKCEDVMLMMEPPSRCSGPQWCNCRSYGG
jgi:hypothetical protein